MKTISVIIPMYNSFHLMERGLQVLSMQKSADIEVIIVDDCSSDDSLSRASEYAAASKMKVIVSRNEKNSGPGVSRNNGMNLATGDYIMFLDSDDYLAQNFSEVLAPLLEKNFDCIIFDYINVSENGRELSKGKSIGCVGISSGLIDPRVALVYTYGQPWGKVYRRERVKQIGAFFGEGLRAEDYPFTKHTIAMSETVYYCAEELYRYVQRTSSLMHDDSLEDERNSQNSYDMLQARLAGKGFEEELLAMELREVCNNTVQHKIRRRDSRREITKYIKQHYTKAAIRNKYFSRFPLSARITSYCAYYRLFLFLYAISRYKKMLKQRMLKM